MAPKYKIVRAPEALLDALDEALTAAHSSDGNTPVYLAAQALLDSMERWETTIITGPEGGETRVDPRRPVSILAPQRNGDTISVPVLLGWLAKPVAAEARGTTEDAYALVWSLLELLLEPGGSEWYALESALGGPYPPLVESAAVETPDERKMRGIRDLHDAERAIKALRAAMEARGITEELQLVGRVTRPGPSPAVSVTMSPETADRVTKVLTSGSPDDMMSS